MFWKHGVGQSACFLKGRFICCLCVEGRHYSQHGYICWIKQIPAGSTTLQLRKNLGLIDVFCIAAGAMISSGIFILPGLAYAKVGPAVVLSYLLAGCLAATGVLSTAELATAMPKAGSDYFFITRSVGPAFGTIAAILNWVSFSLKSAFALIGIGALIRLVVPVDMRISGFIFGSFFIVINLLGVKEAARLQVGLVFALLALMLLYCLRGLPAVSAALFEPFAPAGLGSVFSTAGLVFVAYGGVLKVASVAEEVRNPGRVLPAGMILSLVLISVCYALVVFVTVGVLKPEQLSVTLTPISDGATAVMGRWGGLALAGAAALAFLTTANAGIMAGSRYLLALARDGMLPPLIGKVGARFQTPYPAILTTSVMILVPLFIDLRILVEAASIGLILTNMFAIVSVIILRESRVQNYRPAFRAPLYPWLQIVGLLGFAFVLFEMREEGFAISAVLATLGFCVYWFYGRKRAQSESAFLHLVQRLTARELVNGTLEAELKEIVLERDEIVVDRFDEMTEHSPVLDFDQQISKEVFFSRVAEKMGPRMLINQEKLLALLLAREQESSTVLTPHLAIPHVIIEGAKSFDMLIARARAGVYFSAEAPDVRAIIMLLGSKDERNFHLRCLAAIAQVMQAGDFEERWLAAAGEQALRDIFIMSRRPR